MQKLLTDKKNKSFVLTNNKTKLTLDEIEKFYSIKTDKNFTIGLEYERLSLDKNTLKNASYDKVSKIILEFSKKMNWKIVYDNETIIGSVSDYGASISLEPGCQLEISLEPKENILDIDIELSKIISLLDVIAKSYDVIFLGYGITPLSTVDDIEILNKERYKIMNNYLPYCTKGELTQKMMRQTAGIQINIDYFDKKDAYLKLKFFNIIMPFITALCANSPLENNSLNGYKTSRARTWLYTGSQRCNVFYKDVFSKIFFKYSDIFKNYISEILDVPMIYIVRDNINIPINGKVTFREFMKKGFDGFEAGFEDYILHQSLCFPDIRLKKYIEIRNHDSSNPKFALALCALYKGLSKNNIADLLKRFSFLKLDKIEEYNIMAINKGLDFNINSYINAYKIVSDLINISKSSLNTKEKPYLEPLINIIKDKKTQADIIIDYDIKTARDLVSFLCE